MGGCMALGDVAGGWCDGYEVLAGDFYGISV